MTECTAAATVVRVENLNNHRKHSSPVPKGRNPPTQHHCNTHVRSLTLVAALADLQRDQLAGHALGGRREKCVTEEIAKARNMLT